MRLIDADAFIKMMEEKCDHTASLDEWVLKVCRGGIKKMPTIEAQPERTGKWINGHWDGDSNFRIDGRGNCWFVRECSNCHEEIKGKPTKYCPNCGAKMLMEGEEHETD